MAGMQEGAAPEAAPAPEQGADKVGEAVQMVGSGLEVLIQSAPSPDIAQALQQIQAQIGQILSGGTEGQPSAPETAGATGALPVR